MSDFLCNWRRGRRIQPWVLPRGGRCPWLRPHRRPPVNPQHHRAVASSSSLRRPLQAPGRPIIGHVAPHRSTNSRWAATPSAVLAPSLGWRSVDHARVVINRRISRHHQTPPSACGCRRQLSLQRWWCLHEATAVWLGTQPRWSVCLPLPFLGRWVWSGHHTGSFKQWADGCGNQVVWWATPWSTSMVD
jgi:hypothetical protein